MRFCLAAVKPADNVIHSGDVSTPGSALSDANGSFTSGSGERERGIEGRAARTIPNIPLEPEQRTELYLSLPIVLTSTCESTQGYKWYMLSL
jgi:hypothetical protein